MTARAKKIKDYDEDYEDFDEPQAESHASGFINQLFKMVNRGPSGMILWSASGDSFVITASLGRFEQELLPMYFRHSRFESFVRQLNLYSFRKINQERTSWVYKHDMFHRDRPEDLHLVRRVSGVDGRKNRINLLPASTLIDSNDNEENEIVEITPVNPNKKKRYPSAGIQTVVKKRVVGADLTNLRIADTQAKTLRFTKVLPVSQGSDDSKPMKNAKKTVPNTMSKSTKLPNGMISPHIAYKRSADFVVGTLLTYDDDIESEEMNTKNTQMTPCYPLEHGSPEPGDFVPNLSKVLLNRIAFTIAWPRPGCPDDDLLSASLAVFVLEGFVGKRGLSAGVKAYIKLFPEFANDFHLYDVALRGTPSYLIIEGTPKFTEESMRHVDMIHDFATFAANRLLILPGLENSFLSAEDLASFYSAVVDWKEAVHSLF